MKAYKGSVLLVVALLVVAAGMAAGALSGDVLFEAETIEHRVNPFSPAAVRIGSPFGKIISVQSEPEVNADISGKNARLSGLKPDTTYTLSVNYTLFPGVRGTRRFKFVTYRQTEVVSISAAESLNTSITVVFTRPVRSDSETFRLESDRGAVQLQTDRESTDTVVLTPGSLSQGTTYQLVFPEKLFDINGVPVRVDKIFTFITPGPMNVKLTGSTVSTNRAVLELSFNDRVDAEDLSAALSVSPEGRASVTDNGNGNVKVELTGLKSSTDYQVVIAAGFAGLSGIFLEKDETFKFRTRTPVVYSTGGNLSIEGKTIVVDKASQMVYLYEDEDNLVCKFQCASGVLYPSPGEFWVFLKKSSSMSLYDSSVFYYFTVFQKSARGNNIGFHSIPVYPDGTPAGGLGVPNSHGCVRLNYDDARFLYEWAPIGTRVLVK